MTPDGKELVAGMTGYGVKTFMNSGGNFVLNTTINTGYSFKRVKMSDNHKCLAYVSRDEGCVVVYRRVGHDLVLSQNITEIKHPDISSVDLTANCQQMVIGSQDYGFYYESNGSTFTQVQQLPTDDDVLMTSKINTNHHFILLGSTSGNLYVYSMDSSSHLTS
jgi:23S rRNA A1618 N6-methylase RlmF